MRSLKKLFLFLSIGLLFACSGKENNVKFEEMSENEKISYLNAKIRKEPNNADLFFKRSETLFKKGELTEAYSDIERAMLIEKKKNTLHYYIVMAADFFLF